MNFWRFLQKKIGHQFFLWGHWYPCLGLLVASVLGFKDRVDNEIMEKETELSFKLPLQALKTRMLLWGLDLLRALSQYLEEVVGRCPTPGLVLHKKLWCTNHVFLLSYLSPIWTMLALEKISLLGGNLNCQAQIDTFINLVFCWRF